MEWPSEIPDRREDSRFPFEAEIHICAVRKTPARMVDLSYGGAGFISKEAILPGTPIHLYLVNNNIEVNGMVRYCLEWPGANYRIGISFDTSQKDLVEILIASEENVSR